ncbi:methyltransferase domain-containing [Cordyceps militaris]|uniref:Methyltransferase domain-containing n=1 Tax=Cordyceps militaris TaxID=73501 RepID=A0A2H4SP95_CORMI|nr:methyltransferase domain-containing [Cordyceps militaris]
MPPTPPTADYSQALYDAVLLFHASTGGRPGLLVDVGCGPGNATRALGAHFARAVGLDASPSMVQHAADLTPGASPRFHHATAESLGADLPGSDAIGRGTVDLITAANAAHWFDMAAFWQAAGRALRPRGTVALWIPGNGVVHPATPGAAALDALLQRFLTRGALVPYYAAGPHRLVRDRYRALPRPPPGAGFDDAAFERREWCVGVDKPFLEGADGAVALDVVEHALGTLSPVARWRAAHEASAGSERDLVRRLRRDMEAVLRAHGVREGEERVRIVVDGTLLLFKKSG